MNPSEASAPSRGEDIPFLVFMFICVWSNRSRARLTSVLDYHLSYFLDYNTVRRDVNASGNKGLQRRSEGKMVNGEVQYSLLNTSAGGLDHLHNLSASLY